MKKNHIFLVVFIAGTIAGCSSADTAGIIATGVAKTQQVSQLQTEAAYVPPTATLELVVEPTFDPNFDWTGYWTTTLSEQAIYIIQTGNQINATISNGSSTYVLKATLYANHQIAVGSYGDPSQPSTIYLFQMRIDSNNLNFFQGSLLVPQQAPYLLCGRRDSSESELPCLWP